MDSKEAKAWTDENVYDLLKEYGIPHWSVTITDTAFDGNVLGECTAHLDYEQAEIKIDYDRLKDLKQLERVLRHEICHILHSPFTMFKEVVYPLLDEKSMNSVDQVMCYAQEMCVKMLERMHRGHVDKYTAPSTEDPPCQ